MDLLLQERRAVFADYGQDLFYNHLVHEDWWSKHGQIFLVEDPVHLFRVAMGLAILSPIEPVDILDRPQAVGFRTALTTVVAELKEFRDYFMRYQGQGKRPVPELIGYSNLMVSRDFRQRFCDNPIQIKRQYQFLAA